MKVYEKSWTDAEGTALVIPAGEPYNCFVLDLPHEFLIQKFIVRQKDGSATGFTVDLYNREVCAPGEGSSLSAETSEVSAELAKVIPTQTALAGASVELFNAYGYAFRNMEGTASRPVRKIYLKINPESAIGETTWEVAIAGTAQGARI